MPRASKPELLPISAAELNAWPLTTGTRYLEDGTGVMCDGFTYHTSRSGMTYTQACQDIIAYNFTLSDLRERLAHHLSTVPHVSPVRHRFMPRKTRKKGATP